MHHPRLWRELWIAKLSYSFWNPNPTPSAWSNVALSEEVMARSGVNRIAGVPELAVTSLPALERVLRRSGSHSLTLLIVVSGDETDEADAFLEGLPAVLRPHAARISRLALFYTNPATCARLFQEILPLINLDVVELLSPYDYQHADAYGDNKSSKNRYDYILDAASLVSTPAVMLPKLRTLKSSWSFSWNGTRPSFLSLRRLDFYCCRREAIRSVLVACPALERVTIYLQYFRPASGDADDTLKTLAARVPSVHIKNAHATPQSDVLRLFLSPARTAFSVEYKHGNNVPPYEVANVLADVQDAVHISCALDVAGHAAVRCRDGGGKTRLLVAPSANCQAVVNRLHELPLHALRTLSLHLTDVRHVFPLPTPAPLVERVDIWIDMVGDELLRCDWGRMLGPLESSLQSFPALETLALRRCSAATPALLPATFVNRLVDAMPSVHRVQLWGFTLLHDEDKIRSHIEIELLDCVLPSEASYPFKLLEL